MSSWISWACARPADRWVAVSGPTSGRLTARRWARSVAIPSRPRWRIAPDALAELAVLETPAVDELERRCVAGEGGDEAAEEPFHAGGRVAIDRRRSHDRRQVVVELAHRAVDGDRAQLADVAHVAVDAGLADADLAADGDGGDRVGSAGAHEVRRGVDRQLACGRHERRR